MWLFYSDRVIFLIFRRTSVVGSFEFARGYTFERADNPLLERRGGRDLRKKIAEGIL
jgi:hypothetical protein